MKYSAALFIVSLAFVSFIVGSHYIPHAMAAGTVKNDVQYNTILDYSATNVLLSQQGFTASTTYTCTVAQNTCAQVPNNFSLIPSVLTSLPTGSTYYVSPDYSEAVITTYAANSSPTVTVQRIQGNSLTTIATLPKLNGLVTRVRWSPDNAVLFLSESDGTTQKYTVATRSLTTLTNAVPSGGSWVTISPNGRYIAYYVPNTVSSPTRTFGVIDTVADKSYSLTEPETYWDLLSEGVREFAFSPDSTRLLYLDDRSGYQTLYQVTLSKLAKLGVTGTIVTSKPYSIADMQWVSNTSILMSANRSNPLQWGLYKLNLTTYAISKVSDWAAYDAPMIKLGSNIIFQTADANGRETKFYNTLTGFVTSVTLPGVDYSKTGTTNQIVKQNGMYGVYMKPANTATSTLVVWLHGGPDRQASVEYHPYMSYGGYDWMLNQLKNANVPVLKLDYPGSVNYGMTYAELVKGGVGTVDTAKTETAIQNFAAAHGYKRIYLIGNSYGGYLALKMLVTYPQQISGVLSLSGVTDWNALITNIPSSIFSVDFNGVPNALNANLYAAASILNNVNTVTNQKITIVQGDADSEVPYQQSVILDAALTAANKPHQYYTLAGEDHIYKNPSSYTLICNKAMELVGLPDSASCTMQ